MTDNSSVTVVETGMLTENSSEQLDENKVQLPVKEASKAVPAPMTNAQTASPSASPLEKTSSPSPPQHAAAGEAKTPDSDVIAKTKRFVPQAQYLAIGLLVLVQLATIAMYFSARHKLSEVEKSLSVMNIELGKREAEQDKKFAEALYAKDQNDTESRKRIIAAETLNQLRDGLTEQRLIRKKAGDWYVMGSKEVSIANPEVIEVLNKAYTIAKAAERTGQIVPPHTGNALCVLNPDGKGGTRVTAAYDFVNGRK